MTITWKREGNSECCRMLLHSLSPIPQVLRNLDLQGKQRAILLKQWKASEVCPNCFGTHKQKCNIIGPTGLHSCMGHSKVTMTQWPYAGQAKGLVGISQLEAWERHLKQAAAPFMHLCMQHSLYSGQALRKMRSPKEKKQWMTRGDKGTANCACSQAYKR